jgi:hypothetical protein
MKKKLKLRSYTKTKKSYKKMKSMKGGTKRERDTEQQTPIPPRKSRRISGEQLQTTVAIGEGNYLVTEDVIQTAVNKLNPGVPTIVSLPLPPERHAFLVYIDETNKLIKLADWGIRGLDPKQPTKRRNETLATFHERLHQWNRMQNFYEFMELLRKKYPYEITYYPVDNELYEAANKKHELHHGSGGCSEYIYNWIDKHFPDGKKYIS